MYGKKYQEKSMIGRLPTRRMKMKAVCILALFALASPAFAETPAPVQNPKADQKPYIFDAPPAGDLKSFTPPTPVTVLVPGDPEPKVGPAPAPMPAPKAQEKAAPPQPKPVPKGFG